MPAPPTNGRSYRRTARLLPGALLLALLLLAPLALTLFLVPGSSPGSSPGSGGAVSAAAGAITVSDVDGYYSEYSVVIFVSSIGTNLTMSRTNTYTANREYVKIKADGTLTTGTGGTRLQDTYGWSCNPVNGSNGENRTYATDSYSVSLPRTDLSNAPLLESRSGQRVLRICNGVEDVPSSTVRAGWAERNSLTLEVWLSVQASVNEGSAATVAVVLTSPFGADLAIPLTLTNGTAESGDYGTLDSITVAAGQTTGDGQISTTWDSDTDAETFTVAIDTANLPEPVTAGSPTTGIITINDLPAVPPDPVSIIRVTHNGDSLRVTWAAAATATGYDVTYTNTTTGNTGRGAWGHPYSPLTITCDSRADYSGQNCVESADAYTVGVRAKNVHGESAWANSAPASLPVPAAVSNIQVTHNGTSLTVTWDAPAGATHYDVTYYNSTDEVNARAAWNHADGSASPTLTITCDSRPDHQNQNCVESGDTYTVGVRARNAAGESAWVNSDPATHSE